MLLDTSGLFCLLDADEEFHKQAHALYAASRVRMTHSYAIAEFLPLTYARRHPREPALAFLVKVLRDTEIRIIWVDQHLNQEAINLLEARPDKVYSLRDAVSFVLMRQQGLDEALTTDRHFEQEGFVRLL